MKRTFIFAAAVVVAAVLLTSCATQPYPDEFGFQSRVILSGHTEAVLDIEISENGKYLVSAGMDDKAILWDAENLQQIKELEVHPDDIFSVAIHTGIGKLATGGRDGVIRVFDIESGNRIGLLRGHVEEIYSLEVTPDGKKLLSAGKDKTVRVWDTETGELLHVFQGHTAAVNALAIEPDGSRVISVSGDGSLRTWYLDEMYVPGFTKKISKNNMISIALTEDGKMLAYTGLVMTYDSSTEKWSKKYPVFTAELEENGLENIQRSDQHKNYVWGLAWSPDGSTIVSGGVDRRIFFNDFKNEMRQRIVSPSKSVWDVEYSPDGTRVFAGTSTGDIVVFEK